MRPRALCVLAALAALSGCARHASPTRPAGAAAPRHAGQPMAAAQSAQGQGPFNTSRQLALIGRATDLTNNLPGAASVIPPGETPSHASLVLRTARLQLLGGHADDALATLRQFSGPIPDELADPFGAVRLAAMLAARPPAATLAAARQLAQERADDPLALVIAAEAVTYLHEDDTARRWIARAMHLSPRSARPLDALGALEWLRKNTAAADAAFRQALRLEPHDREALLGEAQLSLDGGHPGRAIVLLEQVRSAYPSELSARLALTRLYLARGEAGLAAGPLGEAERIAPGDPTVVLLTGGLGLAQHNGAAAVAAFETLATRYPKVPELQEDLAQAYQLDAEPADALTASNRALALDPGYWPALVTQVSLALQRGDGAGATAIVHRLQGTGAPRTLVDTIAGDVAASGHDLNGALRDYLQADGTVPSTQLALKIAGIRHALGAADPDASLRAWLHRDPGDAEVRFALAQNLVQEGHPTEAAHQFERVLASEPDQVAALNNLAWIRLGAGQTGQALTLARKAYRLAPHVPMVADTYGWALVQSARAREALPVLGAASAASPGDAEIRLHLAVAQLKTGNRDQARANLKAILAAEPSGPSAEQARTYLSTLDAADP